MEEEGARILIVTGSKSASKENHKDILCIVDSLGLRGKRKRKNRQPTPNCRPQRQSSRPPPATEVYPSFFRSWTNFFFLGTRKIRSLISELGTDPNAELIRAAKPQTAELDSGDARHFPARQFFFLLHPTIRIVKPGFS